MRPVTIFAALPVLDRAEPQMMLSFYAHVMGSGCAVQVDTEIGDSMIHRVRDAQLHRFLQSDCEYYFHLSADMEILNDPLRDNVFKRLLAHDVSFVGGLYAANAEPSHCTSIPHTPASVAGVGELRLMDFLSGGLWFIHGGELRDFIHQHNLPQYRAGSLLIDGAFTAGSMIDGDRLLTEDFMFCREWRRSGRTIWADPGIRLGHWGKKRYELP